MQCTCCCLLQMFALHTNYIVINAINSTANKISENQAQILFIQINDPSHNMADGLIWYL